MPGLSDSEGMTAKMIHRDGEADTNTKDERLTYVDVATGMLDDKGNPRKDIFQKDNLHMTRSGYEIWRDALRPVLVEAELRLEPQKNAGTSERGNETTTKPDAG